MHDDRTERSGLCECGCGQKTAISVQNHKQHGWVKGEPKRFVRGHQTRGRARPFVARHRVEDRGYKTPCWIFEGYIDPVTGYGGVSKGSAHTRYYRVFRGEIPQGLHLDHLCRVHACVNPDHLEPVTPRENVRRGAVPKLDFEKAERIRQMRKEGQLIRVIAATFGVTDVTVHRVLRGEGWPSDG